jgi:hypothetical protein
MRIAVVLSNKLLNLGNHVLHALERTTASGSLGDYLEPDFHLVEPRSVSLKPTVNKI